MENLLKTAEFIHDKKIPIKVLRREPQIPYPLHTHEFCELVIVYNGSGEHYLDYDSNIVKTGDVYVINDNIPHGYRNVANLHLINLIFDMSLIDNSLLELTRFPAFQALFLLHPHFPNKGKNNTSLNLNSEQLAQVMNLIDCMEQEQVEKKDGYQMMITALFMQVIALLVRFYSNLNIESKNNQMMRLATVFSALANDCSKPWTRQELANFAGMSISSLNRTFQEIVNCSPIEYLLRLRLQKACGLLNKKDFSISEIALKCGFKDSNYFCRQFKKRLKYSPKEYRNILRGISNNNF
ncbi:helix-turn-helix domain-containing protein [Lentisphaerota bacterium WC36G]|nr:helix-turn-helix domain-containing protein [Lentisphaerae bacterium WC36]